MPPVRKQDRRVTLEKAMWCFVKLGFSSASIADIEKATGTDRRQVFRDFGSKQALFIECLQTFSSLAGENLLDPLEHPEAGLDQIRATLLKIASQPDLSQARFGCLICNTSADHIAMSEPIILNLVSDFFTRIESAYANALDNCIRKGEIPASTLETNDLAKAMFGAHVGMLVLVKSGQSRETMEQIASGYISMLLGEKS